MAKLGNLGENIAILLTVASHLRIPWYLSTYSTRHTSDIWSDRAEFR